MLIDLASIQDKFGVRLDTVIHVGACEGEEFDLYQHLGAGNVLWVEPDVRSLPNLLLKIANSTHRFSPLAAAGTAGRRVLHLANNQQSSSLRQPARHLDYYPDISFDRQVSVPCEQLPVIWDVFGWGAENEDRINFLNMDTQGTELDILYGCSPGFLAKVDAIYTEINTEEMYYGCGSFLDLTVFLLNQGFELKDCCDTGAGWGDAIYVRPGPK